jgi:hypothetical protein
MKFIVRAQTISILIENSISIAVIFIIQSSNHTPASLHTPFKINLWIICKIDDDDFGFINDNFQLFLIDSSLNTTK